MNIDINERLKRIKFARKEMRRLVKLYNKYSQHYNLTDRILSVYNLKRYYIVGNFDCYVGD
jgi:hypothetical protein